MNLFDPAFTSEDQSAEKLKNFFPFTNNLKECFDIVYNYLNELNYDSKLYNYRRRFRI